MSEKISNNLLSRFAPWSSFNSWVFCNPQKQIVQIRNGYLARWREDPQDNIMPLSKLLDWIDHGVWWGGFGIILGEDNLLCCIDLDNCLTETGEPKNKEIIEFIETARSFTEVSSSGKALHIFFGLDNPKQEFALRSDFSEGKFYVDRFIKLTGVQYRNYDYPVRILNDREAEAIKKAIGDVAPEPTAIRQSVLNSYTPVATWEQRLDNAMIPKFPSQYSGKYRRGKRIVESWKIVCPNMMRHSTDRSGDQSAHLAILCEYEDHTTSISCNHNACKPSGRPNLLQKLWDIIKNTKYTKTSKHCPFCKKDIEVVINDRCPNCSKIRSF